MSPERFRSLERRRRALVLLSIVGGVSLFCFLPVGYAGWKATGGLDEGDVDKGDLILIGRIVDVGMTRSERIDALERSPVDTHHFVTFRVEALKKGTWEKPDISVAVHSPSISFGASKENLGGRHVLAFEHFAPPTGGSVLFLGGHKRCLWILPPCSR